MKKALGAILWPVMVCVQGYSATASLQPYMVLM